LKDAEEKAHQAAPLSLQVEEKDQAQAVNKADLIQAFYGRSSRTRDGK
jgi:hypothetical protein